jgi:hypothetical protein
MQQEKTRLGIDAIFEREREIKNALQAVAEEQATRATIASLLLAFPATPAVAQGSEKKLTYLILRRGPSGLQRLPASNEAALEPGDILQVIPAGAEMAASESRSH